MSVYYIDPVFGLDSNDGLSAATPKQDYRSIPLAAGDTVSFKRGSFYRQQLLLRGGGENGRITYTSYGEGELPVFCGSVDVSAPEDWEETAPHIWRCVREIPGDVGNFAFNGNECTAALRWQREDLQNQGDFWDSRLGEGERKTGNTPQEVLLYSVKNPALYYSHVECISYGTRQLGWLCSGLVIENLHFRNSGVHALAGIGNNITVRNCQFENIGGCVWDKSLIIRFGNAVELWEMGENILVENCRFLNIYDSCVTHQGPGEDTIPARNFICRNNVFDTYGMAAFEYRDKLPIASEFTGNVCKNAGCGFAMLGEILPRKSEIWPQPMGHHIFLWRIEHATEGGSLLIAGNEFYDSPAGAAIYSIIDRAAEDQICLKDNIFQGENLFLCRFGGQESNDPGVLTRG